MLKPYEQVIGAINAKLDFLDDLVAHNPEQIQHLPGIRQRVKEKLNLHGRVARLSEEEDVEAVRRLLGTARGTEIM